MNAPYIEKKQLTITIAIQFYSWILNEFLVMDFCSKSFSEIHLAYLLYQWNFIPAISVKKYQQFFFH